MGELWFWLGRFAEILCLGRLGNMHASLSAPYGEGRGVAENLRESRCRGWWWSCCRGWCLCFSSIPPWLGSCG